MIFRYIHMLCNFKTDYRRSSRQQYSDIYSNLSYSFTVIYGDIQFY